MVSVIDFFALTLCVATTHSNRCTSGNESKPGGEAAKNTRKEGRDR